MLLQNRAYRKNIYDRLKSELTERRFLTETALYLFHSSSENLFAVNLDFDSQRRTQIRALHHGAADQYISGECRVFQRVEECSAARVANHRMLGFRVAVIATNLGQIFHVFQLAG